MKTPSDIILAEMGGVEKVVQIARSVEAMRRGESVDRHDESVQLLAADMILNGVGAALREQHDSKAS